MINHARTLLLNVDGEREPIVSIPGDVYIPAFTAIDDSTLLDARRVLFESGLSYAEKVYRTAQYMGAVHSTEYATYVTDLDPRITYDAAAAGLLAAPRLPARFTQVVASAAEHTKRRLLFGTADVEPYKTFYNLAFNHFALPYRVSGVVLAFIYRMEALRTHV